MLIDSDDVQKAVKAIRAAGLGAVDLEAVLQKYGEPPLTQIPRYLRLRTATELAVRFALEKPGSLIAVCGHTAVSTEMMLLGRNGVVHVLSDRRINDFERKTRFEIKLTNGSRFLGIPATSGRRQVIGYQINLLLTEFDLYGLGLGHSTLDELVRCVRPLPGIENCIITITDDEADE